jgi:hypothetical protein
MFMNTDVRLFRAQCVIAIGQAVNAISWGARYGSLAASDATLVVGFMSPMAISSFLSAGIAILRECKVIDPKKAFFATAAINALAVIATVVVLALLGATPVGWVIAMLLAVGSAAFHTYTAYRSAYHHVLCHSA